MCFHNSILNRGFIQQQTKLLTDPELMSHMWKLINTFPEYDQESFDYLDTVIEKLPNDTADILVTIFWVYGCLHDAFTVSVDGRIY